MSCTSRRRGLLAWLPVCLALACSPPPVDPPEPPAPGYTGELVLARVVTHAPGESPSVFIFAEASFAASDAEDAPSLDAGETAGFRSSPPSAQLDLIRREFLGDIFYQRDPETDPFEDSTFILESDYDAWVAGSELDGGVPPFTEPGALRTPGSLEVTLPDFSSEIQVGAGESLTLEWTGSGPAADRVLAVIVISDGSSGQQIGVQGSDDGSLTIDASTLDQVGPGSGTLTLYRIQDRTFPLPAEGTASSRGMVGETAFLTISP